MNLIEKLDKLEIYLMLSPQSSLEYRDHLETIIAVRRELIDCWQELDELENHDFKPGMVIP